jgi:hypothetical protein
MMEVNDLYNKNYKSLQKEIKEDIREWKKLLCWQISRINIVKIAVLLKTIYMFNAITIKIPMPFFRKIEKSKLQII